MDKKLNCWEFKRCGREVGGSKVFDFGLCPAATEQRLDGIHDGMNAGRACWVIAGTLCEGELQGTFAKKFKNCRKCDFYIKVMDEEFINFKLTANLLNKLK